MSDREVTEFYQLLDQGGITDDIHLFNDKLREWEDYYNYQSVSAILGPYIEPCVYLSDAVEGRHRLENNDVRCHQCVCTHGHDAGARRPGFANRPE